MNKLFLISILLLALCDLQAQQSKPATAKPVAQASATLSFKIIGSSNNTFGYDVFSDGRLLVHQPSIPGKPGNEGFKTKASAEKVAQLVIKKIKKGEMPPTVTTEELKKLKAD